MGRSKSIASSKDTLLIRKNSKTLPRGFTIGPGSESSGESVFGLYGDLMNVEEYEVDSASTSNLEGSRKELRSSDPELETIPYRSCFGLPTSVSVNSSGLEIKSFSVANQYS